MEIILHIALRDIHIITFKLKVFTSHQENYTTHCIEIKFSVYIPLKGLRRTSMEIIRHIASRDIHILTFQLKVFTSNQENYTSPSVEINNLVIHSTKRLASCINGNHTSHCIEGYSYINIPAKSFYFQSRKLYITVRRNKYVRYTFR